LNALRQEEQLAWLASGAEFSFGEAEEAPLPPEQLVALGNGSPGVELVIDGGLTARVYKLRAKEQCWAIKVARQHSLVRNVDGSTAFLNELQRHAQLRALRDAGISLPGVIYPVYGSLRRGLLVSPWIEGEPIWQWDERRLIQVLNTGIALHREGMFEWDYSPGNVLDDGQQVWLFDFGYMYCFDPLTQFNSAGCGTDCTQFHVIERIETRNLFGWLLDLERRDGLESALDGFHMTKKVALEAYRGLRQALSERGADIAVLGWLDRICRAWEDGLTGNLFSLFLREGWRSHSFDLEDDLHGRSCTPRTLMRVDWLIEAAQHSHAALRDAGALVGADEPLTSFALVQRYRERRLRAEAFQVQAQATSFLTPHRTEPESGA
jgi:hypothetical protein